MIVLDTNIFLRHLTVPVTAEDRAMSEVARSLFEAVERGEQDVTTIEAVLHETMHLLAARSHYALPADQVALRMKPILELPGFRLPRASKRRYLRALELWTTYPVLGFADALLAVTALETESELASFDRDFDRVPGLRRWTP